MTGPAAQGPRLADVYSDALGIDSPEAVQAGLTALFEHLSRFVLCGGMPPVGKAGAGVSAEGAAAYGELWVLDAFLTDARAVLTGKAVRR